MFGTIEVKLFFFVFSKSFFFKLYIIPFCVHQTFFHTQMVINTKDDVFFFGFEIIMHLATRLTGSKRLIECVIEFVKDTKIILI